MPIDEIAKIILTCDNTELVKFINKNLGTSYNPKTAKVARLSAEFIAKDKEKDNKYNKRYADTIFSINGYLYNIEIQTTHDGRMIVRIMEYQFNAMLDKLKNIDLSDKYNTTIPLPHSIII